MKKRPLLVIATIETAFLLAGVYFEPTYGVRGTLRGEAFYDGKPTSWWRRELEQWEHWEITVAFNPPPHRFLFPMLEQFSRRSSWAEKMQERWLGRTIEVDGYLGPKVLHDEEAGAVLRELMEDPSPEIRKLAQVGLDHNAEEARFRRHGPAPEVLELLELWNRE